MMKKPTRFYGSGDLHFVTSCCYQRKPFLDSARNRDLFLNVLETMRRSYHFVVLGYVVMPEHLHLLLSEPQRETVSTVIQALKLGFVRRLLTHSHISNTARCGPPPASPLTHVPLHIWQRGFYGFNVWTEKKRI
jgi:REP-associated tyrosine transposase